MTDNIYPVTVNAKSNKFGDLNDWPIWSLKSAFTPVDSKEPVEVWFLYS